MDALNLMNQFDHRSSSALSATASTPYAFDPNPRVFYATDESAPRVYAVVEVFGVAFTQGVNEMQTLANLSSSRDVLKQVDINQTSLARLMEFYQHYKAAVDYQLTRRTPEMIDCLNNNNNNSNHNQNGNSVDNGVARSMVRRKSRASFTGNYGLPQQEVSASLTTAVDQLKLKVLSYNDR